MLKIKPIICYKIVRSRLENPNIFYSVYNYGTFYDISIVKPLESKQMILSYALKKLTRPYIGYIYAFDKARDAFMFRQFCQDASYVQDKDCAFYVLKGRGGYVPRKPFVLGYPADWIKSGGEWKKRYPSWDNPSLRGTIWLTYFRPHELVPVS